MWIWPLTSAFFNLFLLIPVCLLVLPVICRYFLKFEKFSPHKLYPQVDPTPRGNTGPVDGESLLLSLLIYFYILLCCCCCWIKFNVLNLNKSTD